MISKTLSEIIDARLEAADVQSRIETVQLQSVLEVTKFAAESCEYLKGLTPQYQRAT